MLVTVQPKKLWIASPRKGLEPAANRLTDETPIWWFFQGFDVFEEVGRERVLRAHIGIRYFQMVRFRSIVLPLVKRDQFLTRSDP